MTSPMATETGYALESLDFPVQVLAAAVPVDGTSSDALWGWDWRWIDHDLFEVGLLFSAPPTAQRTEELRVAVSARFRVLSDELTVPIATFAHAHAPALLFPYVRQVIDDLTSRSPHGRILLPPTNVMALMTNFDQAAATGARQARPIP